LRNPGVIVYWPRVLVKSVLPNDPARVDDIFEKAIRDGKGSPDLSKSDAYSVRLSIPAQVKDKDFILYIERITNERQVDLSFEEIYELEKIRENQKVDNAGSRNKFLQLGIIEQVGRTSGARYILSHKYYIHKGKSGIYTRLRGLSREHKKELIVQHLRKTKKDTRGILRMRFAS